MLRRAVALLLVLLGTATAVPGGVLIARHYARRNGIEHAVATAEGVVLVLLGLLIAVSWWLVPRALRGIVTVVRLIRAEWR